MLPDVFGKVVDMGWQWMRSVFPLQTWTMFWNCFSLHKAQVTASLHQPAPVSSSRPTREPLPGLSLFDCDTLCGLQCFWWVTEEGFGSCYAGAGANQTRKLSEADAESCLEPSSTKPYEAMCLLGKVTHRVLQELFALLVGRALIKDCFDTSVFAPIICVPQVIVALHLPGFGSWAEFLDCSKACYEWVISHHSVESVLKWCIYKFLYSTN